FDYAPATGGGALHEGAEHAVRGVQPRDCIGERRPEEARPLAIDNHAEKTAQRLRHRVVARPLRVRTARAEAADRAVDEPRIDLTQAVCAGAQALRGSRSEVLYVDIGVCDQPVEQRTIASRLHVERHAALVAVV